MVFHALTFAEPQGRCKTNKHVCCSIYVSIVFVFAAGAPRGKVFTPIHYSRTSIVREERHIRMLQTVSLFN